MGDIKVVSASAGTGKTTYLSRCLLEAIHDSGVQPEKVVATTFTRKSAAELQERVRQLLLGQGTPEMTQKAQRLGAARFGTVHSVCARLVQDFAFDLGLSPKLEVLDESRAAVEFKAVLGEVLEGRQAEELEALARRVLSLSTAPPKFGSAKKKRELHGWQKHVEDLVQMARNNDFGPDDLRRFAGESQAEFLALLPQPEAPPPADRDAALREALMQFVEKVDQVADTTDLTVKALDVARGFIRGFEVEGFLPWASWVKASSLRKGNIVQPTRDLTQAIRTAASTYGTDPRLREDCAQAIRLVFEVAALALEAYRARKESLGVLDFNDQEHYALQLLRRPDVIGRLQGDIQLVLVDEFQDTSPIQLAIFLSLAQIADHSIWVGDRKQAIYGFRGTDPALMETTLSTLGPASRGVPLDRSFRSRPALVALTSELFENAFGPSGIPPTEVSLSAGVAEPPGFGPPIELWNLQTTNVENDALAIALGVRDLRHEGSPVRIKSTTRPVEASDVAVLSFKNEDCARVASALERLGIRTRIAGQGLMGTLEGSATLSALRLFVDPGDSLALAELGRMTTSGDEAFAWYGAVLSAPRGEAFANLPQVRRILSAREAHPHAGALKALDLAISAAAIPELCRKWGDAGARLANLERFRGHASAFAAWCAQTGAGCTPVGLLSWFDTLAENELDHLAMEAGEDAVTVSTFHGAKGLEWPVTVLNITGSEGPTESLLGASVAPSPRSLDLADPLKDRSLRYWPNPFEGAIKGTVLEAPLDLHEDVQRARRDALYEKLRLLYVLWTRAKDRLVLATRNGTLDKGLLAQLGEGALTPPADGRVTWAGIESAVTARELSAEGFTPVAVTPQPSEAYAEPDALPQYEPAFFRPSEAEGTGSVIEEVDLGKHLDYAGKSDDDHRALGDAVHAFFAADDLRSEREMRLAMARNLLTRWGVVAQLSPESLVEAADRFWDWVNTRWPCATLHRELPLTHRLPNGQLVKGNADLVMETPEGFAVIDHKTFPGNRDQALKKAAGHAGQLQAYAQALAAATGKAVTETFIHLPIAGLIVSTQIPEGR